MNKKYSIKSTWTYGDGCDYENGQPQHKLLGPCPICGSSTFDYGGGWRCNKYYCFNSANNPIGNLGPRPSWWNTDINIGTDGDMFTAYRDSFVNLQESNCGFGNTVQEAVDNLLKLE